MSCGFITCKGGEIDDKHDYCEIKTVLPKSFNKNKTKNKPFLINWTSNGEARLHRTCWDILLTLSRKRTKKVATATCDLRMLEEEKLLVKEAAKTVEYFDSKENITQEAKKLAKLIQNSKHCVCFTGAGISTSAGIGDYRGKSGKWTQLDQDKISDNLESLFNTPTTSTDEPACKKIKPEEEEEETKDDDDDGVNYEDLRPTYTHEALQKLLEIGLLKYVISQNGDGLHTLSQIPNNKISELHGNVFIEKCEKCSERYERTYYVMDDACSQYFEDLEDYGKSEIKKPKHGKQCSLCGLSHRTGRKCEKKGCKGYLIDTIINFRDNLEDEIFDRAVDNAKRSDVMLCLGTTLLVTPANELVEMTSDPKTIVICNRQKTPLDYMYVKKSAKDVSYGLRVYGDCDVFLKEVMRNILSPEDLATWESSRPERLKYYDTLRINK